MIGSGAFHQLTQVTDPWRTRWMLAGGVCLALMSCDPASAPVASKDAEQTTVGLEVAAWDGAPVTITVGAVIDHRQPLPESVKRPWIPMVETAEEGERLAEDGFIARVDTEVAERWRDDEVRSGAEREAGSAQSRLRAEGDVSNLRERIADAEGRLTVLAAAIAATRKKDEQELAIARRQQHLALARVERARTEQQRLTHLVAEEVAPQRELIRAENVLALAEAEAEAPQLTLAILEQTTNAIARRRLELDRHRLQVQLEGMKEQLQTRVSGETRAGHIDDQDIERRRLSIAAFSEILEDPEIHTDVPGVLRYQDRGFGVGSKVGWTPFAFVLDEDGLIAVANVSDRWRPWLAVSEKANVDIELPALGRTIPGRVVSIAAQPEQSADGTGSMFRVHIEPLADRGALLPGQSARCAFHLDLSGGAPVAQVPAWMIRDRRHPALTMEDGSERNLIGLFYGQTFLVTEGLQPGERIKAVDRPLAKTTRLVGIVETVQSQPIRVGRSGRRDGWQVRWLIPDGSEVKAGDPVAGLTYSGWGDPAERQFRVAYAELEAEARVVRERTAVAADLAQAAATWRESVSLASSARFEAMVAYLEGDDPEMSRKKADVVRAQNVLRDAQFRVEQLTTAAADAVADNEAAKRRIALTDAELKVRRAELGEVVARRSADHLLQRETLATAAEAQAEQMRLRADYVAARLNGQARLARAQFDYRQALERLERDRSRIEGESLVAPIDGVVFQRPRNGGRLLRPGDWVDVEDPLLMPLGNERKVIFDVPAHLLNRLEEGATFPVNIPALGSVTVMATMSSIGRALVAPRDQSEERGHDARVVRCTVTFTLEGDLANRAPLGSTVYVDL